MPKNLTKTDKNRQTARRAKTAETLCFQGFEGSLS
jgi:hypothetical protein